MNITTCRTAEPYAEIGKWNGTETLAQAVKKTLFINRKMKTLILECSIKQVNYFSTCKHQNCVKYVFEGYHQLQKSSFEGHHLLTALNHPCHQAPLSASPHCSFSSSFSSFEFCPKCQHLTHDPSTAPTHHMVTALA